ncbi:hypothetical protein HJG60_009418 [Phyllostomus discolor]|uniref:Uncharacterized protein n=1 Tax=Phyllostomus discolor TaxID=89673 RepID=A0A833YJ33_9CHIR|nr:hypothetical protein HJG60_009418 [Phyllostomus discolor]
MRGPCPQRACSLGRTHECGRSDRVFLPRERPGPPHPNTPPPPPPQLHRPSQHIWGTEAPAHSPKFPPPAGTLPRRPARGVVPAPLDPGTHSSRSTPCACAVSPPGSPRSLPQMNPSAPSTQSQRARTLGRGHDTCSAGEPRAGSVRGRRTGYRTWVALLRGRELPLRGVLFRHQWRFVCASASPSCEWQTAPGRLAFAGPVKDRPAALSPQF